MQNKWKEWILRLKGREKLPKKNQILILLLAGILLLVIVFPVPEQTQGVEKESMAADTGEENPEHYQEYLEQKMAETLEQVEGVGKVSVMITLKSSEQKIIEKDEQNTSQAVTEEDSEGGVRSTADESYGETSIYVQDGDGRQSPYVSKELTPEIEGVIVIADGGDNAVVVQNITEAVQALFGVEAHKIKIMKRHST